MRDGERETVRDRQREREREIESERERDRERGSERERGRESDIHIVCTCVQKYNNACMHRIIDTTK